MAQINGIAHIQLTVSSMQRSVPFYRGLLESLEMQILMDQPDYFYCIGARTGISIAPAADEFAGDEFHQRRPGLHHLCFRGRSNSDVDEVYQTALALGATIIRAPEDGGWAPGYYSTLFEDPDGIRIEVNYVPGKGHLKQDTATST